MLQSGGQHRRWPTSGTSGYKILAASGVPNALERGTKSALAFKRGKANLLGTLFTKEKKYIFS